LKTILERGVVAQVGKGTIAVGDVVEIALPFVGSTGHVRLSFWRDGLPIQAIPPQGYLQIPTLPARNA
jgi:hypothetical protein